jgi:hypothetical protein
MENNWMRAARVQNIINMSFTNCSTTFDNAISNIKLSEKIEK